MNLRRSSSKVFGVGIFEYGKYNSTVDWKPTWQYRIWQNMLKRCYSKIEQDRKKSYIGCTVDERFHKFQEFMLWAEQQIGFGIDGWELDKDLLVKNNKIYSPDNCVFLPHRLNTLLIRPNRGELPIGVSHEKHSGKYKAQLSVEGKNKNLGRYNDPEIAFLAYKVAKEMLIKDQAEKWEDQIDPRAYEALINYKVEITD